MRRLKKKEPDTLVAKRFLNIRNESCDACVMLLAERPAGQLMIAAGGAFLVIKDAPVSKPEGRGPTLQACRLGNEQVGHVIVLVDPRPLA